MQADRAVSADECDAVRAAARERGLVATWVRHGDGRVRWLLRGQRAGDIRSVGTVDQLRRVLGMTQAAADAEPLGASHGRRV